MPDMEATCHACGHRYGMHEMSTLRCPSPWTPASSIAVWGYSSDPQRVFTPVPVHLWIHDPDGTSKCGVQCASEELTEDPALVTCPMCITVLCEEIIG